MQFIRTEEFSTYGALDLSLDDELTEACLLIVICESEARPESTFQRVLEMSKISLSLTESGAGKNG